MASLAIPLRGRNDKKELPSPFSSIYSQDEYRDERRELDEGEGPLISQGISPSIPVFMGRASSLRQLSHAHENHYFCVPSVVVYFLPSSSSRLVSSRKKIYVTIVTLSFLGEMKATRHVRESVDTKNKICSLKITDVFLNARSEYSMADCSFSTSYDFFN